MTPSLVPSLLAFIAVIAMIPLALWLMKRAQVLRPGVAGPLSLVAGLSMGARERIAVVHAGGRYLVIGITAQQMTLLSTLDEWPGTSPVAGDSSAEPAGSALAVLNRSPFARLLRRIATDDSSAPKS